MAEHSVAITRRLRRRMAAGVFGLYSRRDPRQFYGFFALTAGALLLGLWQTLAPTRFVPMFVAIAIGAAGVLALGVCLPVLFVSIGRSFSAEMPVGARQTLQFDSDGYWTSWSDRDGRSFTHFSQISNVVAVGRLVFVSKQGSDGYTAYPREVFPPAEQRLAIKWRASNGSY